MSKTLIIENLPHGSATPTSTKLREILMELFTQSGPVQRISIRNNNSNNRSAFIDFVYSESVDFAIKVMETVTLFGKKLKIERKESARESGTISPKVKKARYIDLDRPRSEQNNDEEQNGHFSDEKISRNSERTSAKKRKSEEDDEDDAPPPPTTHHSTAPNNNTGNETNNHRRTSQDNSASVSTKKASPSVTPLFKIRQQKFQLRNKT